jgi:hypothetical protein
MPPKTPLPQGTANSTNNDAPFGASPRAFAVPARAVRLSVVKVSWDREGKRSSCIRGHAGHGIISDSSLSGGSGHRYDAPIHS